MFLFPLIGIHDSIFHADVHIFELNIYNFTKYLQFLFLLVRMISFLPPSLLLVPLTLMLNQQIDDKLKDNVC
jgi:hypothetical protein